MVNCLVDVRIDRRREMIAVKINCALSILVARANLFHHVLVHVCYLL